ncbi:MAG: IS200/IS605 family accessory protein TnpB-related protein, partial [Candidatus Thermoplasmatota archaeon]|nr:IS200/IS605 family accessory protein TnpB-related protein [Candidatus Thermoplasmatota archaeon]
MLHRAVVFHIQGELPFEARMLMEDFRLAVNSAIRVGLQARVTSRNALAKLAYKNFRKEHPSIYSQHLVSSFEVAGSILKNLRRRWGKGPIHRIPYVRRRMMKAENQAYKLDRENGVVDLPIRAGCHVKLRLVLSDYHRVSLKDESFSLGILTLLPDRVIIAFRKSAPKSYTPETALSLDTNERSLDGVFLSKGESLPVQAAYPDIAIIQARHHDRRKRLQKKKAHDRRTSRRLCNREGRRERHRIEYRMHQVANAVLGFVEEHRAAVVLEDLTGMAKRKKDRSLNRRLSSWPRRKLHSIIEYKAAWKGVPVIKVDPYNSSRRCPICGRVKYSRMGTEFECESGWRADRHVKAGINLLQTAFPEGMAGGLRFSPGAFQHDVVMTLYDPEMGAR